MGDGTAAFPLLKRTLPDKPLLRTERTLKENRPFEFAHQFSVQRLHSTDFIELRLVMLFAGGVPGAYLTAILIALIKVLAQKTATGILNVSVELLYAFFYFTVALFGLFEAIAQKSTALGDMIQCSSENKPVSLNI
jgi:hypothetical protein